MRRFFRIKGSYVVAAVITAVLAAWIATGEIVVGGQSDTNGSRGAAENGAGKAEEAFRVAVKTFTAQERNANLVVRGRTEAEQRVQVKAETAGRVVAISAAKGQRVAKGDIVCKLDAGVREARVLQARAQLAQAELEAQAAGKLSEKGFAAETRVRATKAALDGARAVLAEAELDLVRTEMTAPFSGIIEQHTAEVGDYLNVANPCVTMASRDPLLAVGQVSELDVAALKKGMTGTVALVTGETAEGTLRFIASASDSATRTFRIELEVPNPDGSLRDGVTASIDIPLRATRAHKLSPAYLALDDAGNIGVKTVDENNLAQFAPVTILGDEKGHVWVDGLPEMVTIIVVGQDYVLDGAPVEPVAVPAGDA